MADNHQSSYRSIFKATSVLGGVQAYKVIIQIVKSKIVALLIGPEGYGIFGLFASIQQVVQSVTSFGLSSSAVRDISEAAGVGDKKRVSRVSAVLKRLVWITGVLGATVLIVFSPVLSNKVFGSSDYIIPLILLSTTLILDQLSAGQLSVLQGLHKIESLAKASAIGATVGLCITIPLYYFWGVDGIVPTMVLYSISTLVISYIYYGKLKIERIKVSNKEAFAEGRNMLKLGIALSLSSIFSSVVGFILRSYISRTGGVEQVGFFTSGHAIMGNYVGLIFTALATDYYPRLAAVNTNNTACRSVINQEGEIATLILTPMLIICVVFMPLIIPLLYSKDFSASYDYIIWSSVGIFLRLSTWLLTYQLPAKGEGRLYIINEMVYSSYSLVLSILGYKFLGLKGLGMGYSIAYLVYFVQIYILVNKKWGFSFSTEYKKIMIACWLLFLLTFISVFISNHWVSFSLGAVMTLASLSFSLYELDKRMKLRELLHNFKKNA